MAYDESYCKFIFPNIVIPLFIKWIRVYTSSVYVIFPLIFFVKTWLEMHCLFQNYNKTLSSKPDMNQKLNSTRSISHNHWYKKIIIYPIIKTIHLQKFVTAVISKPYFLWWFASHMKFLINCQPFIHWTNLWIYLEYFI